jgi:uncharacterized protein YqeY
MLHPKLRDMLTKAMKERDEKTRDICRLVIAEIERQPSCGTEHAQRQLEFRVVRKLIEGNNETLKVMPEGDPRHAALTWENNFLAGLLPIMLSVAEIRSKLEADPVTLEKIRNAKNSGAATGPAVALMRKEQCEAAGADVQQAVREIRGETAQ